MATALTSIIFVLLLGIIFFSFILFKRELLISLFLLLLSTNQFLPEGLKLSSSFTIYIDDIALISLLIFFLMRPKSSKLLTGNQKNAIFMAVFIMCAFPIYITLKNFLLFPELAPPPGKMAIRILKSIARTYCIYYIIVDIFKPKTPKYVDKTFIVLAFMFSVSILFQNSLATLGFTFIEENAAMTSIDKVTHRITGFSASGDANVAGMIFAILFGYYISNIEITPKHGLRYYIAAGLVFLAILKTGSRAAFAAIIIIMCFFLFKNIKSFKKKMVFIFLTAVMGFILIKFGDVLTSRLTDRELIEKSIDTESISSRPAKWFAYIQDIIQNPHYLLLGRISLPPIERDVHSAYIKMIWEGGLILFIPTVIIFKRIIKQNKFREKGSISVLYPLLGFLIPSITISTIIPPLFLPIIIALADPPKKTVPLTIVKTAGQK